MTRSTKTQSILIQSSQTLALMPKRFVLSQQPLLALQRLLCGSPAFAVNKEMVQLQTQVQQLQDAVARLQQSNDERMGVMKDLIQQSADSVNRMSVTLDCACRSRCRPSRRRRAAKIDQVSGQIQSLNDSLDEIKARLGSLQKLLQDVQGQQQSMNANMQNQPQPGRLQGADSSPAPAPQLPSATSPSAHRAKGQALRRTSLLRRIRSVRALQALHRPTISTRPPSATTWPRNTRLRPPSSAT